jgi:integrase
MARPFKKQTVRYYTPDGQRCSPDTPGATKRVEESRKYYGLVPQPDGRRKPVPLCPDLGRSKQILNKLLSDATMLQHGLADPYEGHRKRPLADHLADFRAYLTAKGNHPRHVRLTLAHLDAVFAGIGAAWLADLDAGKAGDWLAARRVDRRPVTLPEGVELFRMAEVTRLLGIKRGSVAKAIQRQGLAAVGKGPARRYPRATVEALAESAARGVAPETVNHYTRSLRSFGRWLVRSRRWPSNPFETLALLNAATDRRRDRRELDACELRRLLGSARDSQRSFRGLDGPDRFHLYATACGTGFRASALASLTPESFDLAGKTPTVTLAARHAKNRKTKVQPIPEDLAELLRGYLADKPAGKPVWGGTWATHFCGAAMLRDDLKSAGIPYAVEGPDGPLYLDFHALRHTYLR